MADGFIDYATFEELNRPEEERLMDEALARAQAADEHARAAGARASVEAQGRYNTAGQIVGDMADITQTASYSDYLKAKQDAEAARRSVMGPTGDFRRDAVREQMGTARGLPGQLAEAQRAQEFREGRRATEAREGYAGVRQQRAAEQERRRAADAEAQRRADAEAQHLAAFQDTLRQRFAQQWQGFDAAANNFWGGYKGAPAHFAIYEQMGPLGSSAGGEDAERLAQMGRNVGLDKDVNRFTSGATYEWGKRTKGGY